MPISLENIRNLIDPRRCILLLGAGASVPSGAPSGESLAHRLWREVAKSEPQSDDLCDTASILERRYGRAAIVDVVRSSLLHLQPTGGLLALPQCGWNAVFSTNFDKIIENSYKKSGIPLTVIRSNYDLTSREIRDGATLYKIHGCLSQDRCYGDKASMILSEQDYENFDKYRQSMFSSLQTMMLSNDVVIVGQSLRDRHLSDLVKRVLSYKEDGISSEVYIVVYNKDDLRAPLFEDRGGRVVFGGIDDFAHALCQNLKVEISRSGDISGEFILPPSLISTVLEIGKRKNDAPNALRMFNGAPATYADVRFGVTFERSRFLDVADRLSKGGPVVVVTGAAGVGKTTFARQVALKLVEEGGEGWEHRNDFPFQCAPWLYVENELRAAGKTGVLVLDECTRYLRQANMLIDALGRIEGPALRILATANAAQWVPRLKSPVIFSKGLVIELSKLDDVEISSLINLYQSKNEVGNLVNRKFRSLPRGGQVARLREKCGADMFVCLKNIFANENLDTILLAEFEELGDSYQEYYRYVAALEAVGTRVHRQLLMRMLNIPAQEVSAILNGLSGIIDEYDINPKMGVYGWSTRHLVIARKITEYKFSNSEEMEKLLYHIIDNINPAISIELQSVRDLCDAEFGIGRISESSSRQNLYRRLIEVAPGERIPWHRLVREFLDYGSLEDAEYCIRNAIDAVGSDGPLDRYSVRLLLARADRIIGIGDGDRLALVRRAYELAETNISKHPKDKFSYRVFCDVAVQMVRRGESIEFLDRAIDTMRDASIDILDPEMDRALRGYEDVRSRI